MLFLNIPFFSDIMSFIIFPTPVYSSSKYCKCPLRTICFDPSYSKSSLKLQFLHKVLWSYSFSPISPLPFSHLISFCIWVHPQSVKEQHLWSHLLLFSHMINTNYLYPVFPFSIVCAALFSPLVVFFLLVSIYWYLIHSFKFSWVQLSIDSMQPYRYLKWNVSKT